MCSFQRHKSERREWNRNLFLQPRQLTACLSDPSLRRWGRAFVESRRAPPWLLRLEKDKYSGSARGMRLPHESNRGCVRANCFLPPETRRGNCSWGPRAQFRWKCAVHDASGDEENNPAATVHGPDEGDEFQTPQFQEFTQEKRA